jgi:hypothetical protein
MQIYNQSIYHKEHERVWNYTLSRAVQKVFPDEYLDILKPLATQMYELCELSSYHLNILPEYEDVILDINLQAQKWHGMQKRQFIDMPYIIHPREVATRSSYCADYEAVIAALLHDVVEDCGVSHETIHHRYGKQVALYVKSLTDPAQKTDGNRAERMAINFEHFKQSVIEIQNVKLCDLLSNTRSIVICDANFAKTYVPELKMMNEYFQNKKELDSHLVNLMNAVVILSEKIVAVQDEYRIVKLEKKKSKNIST